MRILHLEDSSSDAELIRRMLCREWPDCAVRQVADEEAYRSALVEGNYDLILSDYSMPGFDGLSALAQARRESPATPFLFLSGMIGEERAVEALKNGASDYIIKDRPARLVPAIRRALAFVAEAAQRRSTEQALRQNDERLRLIAENIAEHITVFTLDGRPAYSNRAARELFGIRGAGSADDWFDTVDSKDRSSVRHALERVAASGRSERFDYRIRVPDSTERFLEAHAGVLRDGSGRISQIIFLSRDVTERRNAELRLREQASLLDKARDAIMVTDLEHRIGYWNASAERVYGIPSADAVGKRFDELGLDFDPAQFAGARSAVLAKGEWRGEFDLRTRSGASVIVESTWSLVVESDGRPRSILAIDTDVTESRRLKAQLLRTQRLESIGTLAGGVAHDLNNVLTPILLTIDLLAGHVRSAEDHDLIEKTRASANHGAALVRQLLAFARGGEGERIRTDAYAALSKVEPLIRQSLPSTVTLSVRRGRSPLPVEVNSTQFDQVLLNLALNARDAMPAGGRLGIAAENATVDAPLAAANPGTQPGLFVRISVSDTGMGMRAAVLDRIFDPFFTTKPQGKGIGLGLSMVAGILKSHRGFVQVESEPGRGTTFHLYFPAAATDAGRDQVARTPQEEGSGEEVLLVDDEPAVRETLRSLLHRAGYVVHPAGNATAAVREFARNRERISLVITDMMLPDRSGLEVVRELRAVAPALPIIAISGMMASGEFDELLYLNPPVQCLAKPLPPKVLLHSVCRALHEVRSSRAGTGPRSQED